jgi:predicted nucleotidyltransferase
MSQSHHSDSQRHSSASRHPLGGAHELELANLNTLMRDFTDGVVEALSSALIGVYLVGSFVLGDADRDSDVDFLVVISRPLDAAEQGAVRALHKQLYDLPNPWAHHLEGSYAPQESLRDLDDAQTKWLYLDNGANELTWDEHCNSAVSRWVLREYGRPLAGPDPRELVDVIEPDQLRAEVGVTMAETKRWAETIENHRRAGDALAFSHWAQTYLVVSVCRMLHTRTYGTVVSKRAAADWALTELEDRWRDLIRQAIQDRPDPWIRANLPSSAELAIATVEFVSHACRITGGTPARIVRPSDS